MPLCPGLPLIGSGVGRVGCHGHWFITVNVTQQTLGSQVVTHFGLPGTVIVAVEGGDKGGDVFGGHVDVVSERNQQSAKELKRSTQKI